MASACADDGNPCTNDQCDGAGHCAHPNNTNLCDDGDACTINDVCSGGSCAGTPSSDPLCGLDHFKCYKATKARPPKSQTYPEFTPRSGLDVVVDEFGTTPLDLKKAISVCNPANKNDEDPTAPGDVSHLESYKASVTRTVPSQPRFVKSIHQVQNQFGTIRLQLNAVDRLMVPSAKVLGAGGAPPYTATGLDHFKCYKASVAKLPGNVFAPELGVKLVDQFGGPLFYDLKKPTRLCAPADKDGEDASAPGHAAHLVCYLAKLSRMSPAQARFSPLVVSTSNQFGNEVLKLTAIEELCVPSLKLD